MPLEIFFIRQPRGGNSGEIVQAIVESAESCRTKVKETGKIKAISAALPSGIDYKNGVIIQAPNLPCLNGFPRAAVLEK
jgi:hypothetical protein